MVNIEALATRLYQTTTQHLSKEEHELLLQQLATVYAAGTPDIGEPLIGRAPQENCTHEGMVRRFYETGGSRLCPDCYTEVPRTNP